MFRSLNTKLFVVTHKFYIEDCAQDEIKDLDDVNQKDDVSGSFVVRYMSKYFN